jgi:hypothetical protein
MILEFTVMWFMIIVTLFLIMYAIAMQYRYNEMTSYPIPQCYNDWLCMQNNNGIIEEVNMSRKVIFDEESIFQICAPLTQQNVCNFTYVNQSGELVTEQPGNYINTWSLVDGCSPENNYAGCPFYNIGDIYWRACYNNIEGNYYNNPERTYGPENTTNGNCT